MNLKKEIEMQKLKRKIQDLFSSCLRIYKIWISFNSPSPHCPSS
jgi:hypothetical protein